MVQYRRNFILGGTYFFTVTLADRRSNALVDNIDTLRSASRVVRRARPFSADAIVKGHFSSVLIETGLHLKRWSNGDLALWQRRFWEHTIRDEADLARHIDYVHFNPVKHGLVQRVRDWPYSSFHRYVREGLLPGDWAGDDGEKGAGFGEPSDGRGSP